MALQTNLRVNLNATLTKVVALATSSCPVAVAEAHLMQTGTGANQADKMWQDNDRTLTASATEDLDLAGVLTDALGDALTFVKVKLVLLIANAANVNNVHIGMAAANGVPGIWGAAGDYTVVKPGGVFLWFVPGTGATVTAGTGDKVTIANSGGGSSVLFDIVIIGTSA